MLSLVAVLAVLTAINGKLPQVGAASPFPNRIVSGEDAMEGEFPFMLSLRRKFGSSWRHNCGATILTKTWAMTAAHCCRKRSPSDSLLYSGSIYLDPPGTSHEIDKIILHELFDNNYIIGNDICVIHVKEPFTFDKNVQRVTLPGKDFQVNPGDGLAGAGWGRTSRFSATPPNRMQKIDSFVGITNEECGKDLKVPIFDGYICAKGSKKGQAVCYGDSGGPLLKDGVQVGITSWSKPPCTYPTPDVYARVSHYIDWIKEKLGPDANDLAFSE